MPQPSTPIVAGRTKPPVLRDFFTYVVNFNPGPAAGLPASTTIQVQADSDFELQKLAFFADIALAAVTESTRVLPLVTIQLTDQGSGRQIFSLPVPIPAIMGDGRIPFILPTTKIFVANSAIGVDIANYSSATTYNIRIALIGAKIFRLGTL
jgi:hypothetical protein